MRLQPRRAYSAQNRIIPMQTRVQKWGNGLGVRIPQALAGQIGLGAGSEESLSARDDLLAGVTAENLHPSVEREKLMDWRSFDVSCDTISSRASTGVRERPG